MCVSLILFLVWLLWLALPELCWGKVVIVGILFLYLIYIIKFGLLFCWGFLPFFFLYPWYWLPLFSCVLSMSGLVSGWCWSYRLSSDGHRIYFFISFFFPLVLLENLIHEENDIWLTLKWPHFPVVTLIKKWIYHWLSLRLCWWELQL